MKRLVIAAVALAAAMGHVEPVAAQWATGCGSRLEITVRNETRYKYSLKINGVEVRTINPGEHIHVLQSHGRFHIEAVSTNGGPRYSQRLDTHQSFVWLLRTPPIVRAQEPDATPPEGSKPDPAPTNRKARNPVPDKGRAANQFYPNFLDAGGIGIAATAAVRP